MEGKTLWFSHSGLDPGSGSGSKREAEDSADSSLYEGVWGPEQKKAAWWQNQGMGELGLNYGLCLPRDFEQ